MRFAGRSTSSGRSQSRQDEADPSALSLRIGINVEDVIVDDGILQGDGVNIASRIHQAAEPGQIVVTADVRDYVINRLPVKFRDLGTPAFKNIARRCAFSPSNGRSRRTARQRISLTCNGPRGRPSRCCRSATSAGPRMTAISERGSPKTSSPACRRAARSTSSRATRRFATATAARSCARSPPSSTSATCSTAACAGGRRACGSMPS